MPELPEVETIKRGLELLVIDKMIRAVTHDNPKSFPNIASEVDAFLIGATIIGIRRRAKVLLVDLSTEYTLVIHLKMTGQLVYVNKKPNVSSDEQSLDAALSNGPSRTEGTVMGVAQTASQKSAVSQTEQATCSVELSGDEERWGAGHPSDSLIGVLPDKSTRVTLEFKDGSHLYFNDQRKFGWIKLYPTIEVPNIDFMKKVGPEPLELHFKAQDFVARMRRRNRTTIKAALLDQTVIAGVGNIYADESLWAAKIHPASRVEAVSNTQLSRLLQEIRAVMELSIEKGGSTDRNYVDASGKKGSYLTFANVFRREGQPCNRCGTLIVKSRVAGRGTHTCPKCQKVKEVSI